MSLLSLLPLPYRLLALAALAVALMGFGWVKGAEHGENRLQAYIALQQKQVDTELTKRLVKENALNLSQRRIADDLSKANKARAVADSRATDSLQRLKTALDNPAGHDSGSASGIAGAGIEGELLGQCATAYRDVASEAERLKEKAVGLQTYIIEVCLSK